MSTAEASDAPPKTPTTYECNCHCGNIRFAITLSDALAPQGTYKLLRCTCSICTKNGYLLVYPLREDVVWHDGSDARLKDYFMGLKNKPHRFCPECSSSVLIDFLHSDAPKQRPYLAVNARMIKDIDLGKADYQDFDGWNRLQPPYQAPA